jgi:dolichol-phosphate mannosyltransferase
MRVVNIIPTYNEKETIGVMLSKLAKVARKNRRYQFKTLVMDDNSPDGTGEIVKAWMKKDKSVFLLTGQKKGLGHALLRGFQYAVKILKADVIVPNDADLSWDPEKTPKLLEKIDQGYDVVVASRYGSGQVKGWGFFRKLNHWISNVFFATYVAGIKEVKDHNGNFRAIRVKGVLDKVPLGKLIKNFTVKGFAFEPYMLYELSRVTDKFCEVPVVFKFRTKGEAKIGSRYLKFYIHDIIEYIRITLKIRLDRMKRGTP